MVSISFSHLLYTFSYVHFSPVFLCPTVGIFLHPFLFHLHSLFTFMCQMSVCTVYFIPFFLLNYILSLFIILYSFFPQAVKIKKKHVIIRFVFIRPYSNFFRVEKVWESFSMVYEFIVKLKIDFSS